MKKFEFETTKGKFLLIDLPVDVISINKEGFVKYENDINYQPLVEQDVVPIGILEKLTNEKLSKIVEETIMSSSLNSKNYKYRSYSKGFLGFETEMESLHSLLASEGIYLYKIQVKPSLLMTPRSKTGLHDWEEEEKVTKLWEESEQKTFYNPYIFRL